MLAWCTSNARMQHEALLAPVRGACGVWGGRQQDLVVHWILFAPPKLHVEKAAESSYWAILVDVYAEGSL